MMVLKIHWLRNVVSIRKGKSTAVHLIEPVNDDCGHLFGDGLLIDRKTEKAISK